MRCGSRGFHHRVQRSFAVAALLLAALPAVTRTESPGVVSRQRYAMGTMFDLVVFHAPRQDAERAIDAAMAEIVRLDGVMSDYQADSGLSRLNREGRRGLVAVDPSLYEVVRESLVVSRRSGGAFDVTIAPLLKTWRKAAAEGRRPSADEITQARRCVGYGQIDVAAPDRIGFRSDCLEIDLGGIGKGYAVDRAMAILEAAGIRDALINAGSSSIAAIGAPPGRNGWPVTIGADASAGRVLVLAGNSVSTSQQDPAPHLPGGGLSSEIIDPAGAAPVQSRLSVSVVAPRATVSDALSTALLVLPVEEGKALVAQFAGASALWLSAAGEVHAAFRFPGLERAASR